MDRFIADFLCAEAKLIIEVDGSQHFSEQGLSYDKERTAVLEALGYTVLRITNEDVNHDFDGVCEMIDKEVKNRITMTRVVAALIWRENRFLICRRPAHKTRGLLWEFVGGKVEKGETKQQALARECREELAVEIEVGEVYMQVVHPYPDMTVELTLFCAAITKGEPQLLEHCALAWITPDEIDGYDFCPADVEILAKLKRDSGVSPR